MTRAAALTYTSFFSSHSSLILLTAIGLALGLGYFAMTTFALTSTNFSWDFPMDDLLPFTSQCEHIPLQNLVLLVLLLFCDVSIGYWKLRD